MYIVFQVITLCCQSFFIFHKLVQVIFGCSSCFALRSHRYDESKIRLSCFSGPSVWVAIRRAFRHFSFFCVSTQFVMFNVSIFHQFLWRFSVCSIHFLIGLGGITSEIVKQLQNQFRN